jgi:hypothetical protein
LIFPVCQNGKAVNSERSGGDVCKECHKADMREQRKVKGRIYQERRKKTFRADTPYAVVKAIGPLILKFILDNNTELA